MNGLSQNLLGNPWITTSCRETTPLYAPKKAYPDNAVKEFLENIDKSLDGMNLKMSQKKCSSEIFPRCTLLPGTP
ncbi:hypothetical protein OM236_09165 [Escherichia albertii]|uniref:hypothetical protein n=1 Tax=Escherichia albertii TaxID=208962 RepID=UPI0013DE0563|nr:hypothetical protein [Escherichia albertii]MCZ9034153.1 hypothetical protein [Escherichia albertii]